MFLVVNAVLDLTFSASGPGGKAGSVKAKQISTISGDSLSSLSETEDERCSFQSLF